MFGRENNVDDSISLYYFFRENGIGGGMSRNPSLKSSYNRPTLIIINLRQYF